MTAVVQQLRTTDATKIPTGLEPGQVAFNLTNHWMFVGIGGANIVADGTTLTAYNNTQTILGVSNIAVPAKPAAGKGYEIYPLETTPYVAGIFGIADSLVNADTGANLSAKITGALVTAGTIASASVLKNGDMAILSAGTGSPFATVPLGSYVWDGTKWMLTGGSTPDASTTSKGVVRLGLATDVVPTGGTGATVPNALAVATAAQLKATNAQVAALQGGTTLLGTYDASASKIVTVSPQASSAGRGGLAVNGKVSAGTGLQSGDLFIVHAGGTIAGDATGINKAVNSGDTLLYDGSAWTVIATGPVMGGTTLHGCTDVADTTVATVTAANVKGILVRDSSVATDGDPAAYKLASIIDLGTF